MKTVKISKKLLYLLFMPLIAVFFTACSDSIVDENITDDEFIKEVITNGYSNPNNEDDDLMSSEVVDLDDGGAVGNGGGDTPIDSLIKWGRRITGSSVTVTITSEGDTIKNADITRTVTGNFIIIGTVSGVVDTIVKPYTEVFHRKAVFKRVAYTNRVRHNWRLYKVSMVDGGTTAPQNSEQYVQIQQVQLYLNNVLTYTFQGPDFTQNMFVTKRFEGPGIPEVHTGDQIKLVVSTYSTQPEQDIVAWHWGKRNFGFHREPFTMTSEIPNGNAWDRVYEKTITIASGHIRGRFNGFISASTHKSLYDDSPLEFASDLVGAPYRRHP